MIPTAVRVALAGIAVAALAAGCQGDEATTPEAAGPTTSVARSLDDTAAAEDGGSRPAGSSTSTDEVRSYRPPGASPDTGTTPPAPPPAPGTLEIRDSSLHPVEVRVRPGEPLQLANVTSSIHVVVVAELGLEIEVGPGQRVITPAPSRTGRFRLVARERDGTEIAGTLVVER